MESEQLSSKNGQGPELENSGVAEGQGSEWDQSQSLGKARGQGQGPGQAHLNPLGGGRQEAPSHDHESTEHKEDDSKVQVVDTAEDGRPRVRVTAGGGGVQEFQDQPGGAHCQPHHEAPEGPLGKTRQGRCTVRGRPGIPRHAHQAAVGGDGTDAARPREKDGACPPCPVCPSPPHPPPTCSLARRQKMPRTKTAVTGGARELVTDCI